VQYAKTRERRGEQTRAYYDENAMAISWRQWRRRHKRRLATLETRLAEGGQ
jgi:hypothetical protein